MFLKEIHNELNAFAQRPGGRHFIRMLKLLLMRTINFYSFYH